MSPLSTIEMDRCVKALGELGRSASAPELQVLAEVLGDGLASKLHAAARLFRSPIGMTVVDGVRMFYLNDDGKQRYRALTLQGNPGR